MQVRQHRDLGRDPPQLIPRFIPRRRIVAHRQQGVGPGVAARLDPRLNHPRGGCVPLLGPLLRAPARRRRGVIGQEIGERQRAAHIGQLPHLLFDLADQIASLQEFQLLLGLAIKPDQHLDRHNPPQVLLDEDIVAERPRVLAEVTDHLRLGPEIHQSHRAPRRRQQARRRHAGLMPRNPCRQPVPERTVEFLLGGGLGRKQQHQRGQSNQCHHQGERRANRAEQPEIANRRQVAGAQRSLANNRRDPRPKHRNVGGPNGLRDSGPAIHRRGVPPVVRNVHGDRQGGHQQQRGHHHQHHVHGSPRQRDQCGREQRRVIRDSQHHQRQSPALQHPQGEQPTHQARHQEQ